MSFGFHVRKKREKEKNKYIIHVCVKMVYIKEYI